MILEKYAVRIQPVEEAIMHVLPTKLSFFNTNRKVLSAAMYTAQAFGAQYECTRPRETGSNLDKEEQHVCMCLFLIPQ